jgi:hypothetical protein
LPVLLSLTTTVAPGSTPSGPDIVPTRLLVDSWAVAAAEKRTKRHISFKVLYILLSLKLNSSVICLSFGIQKIKLVSKMERTLSVKRLSTGFWQ